MSTDLLLCQMLPTFKWEWRLRHVSVRLLALEAHWFISPVFNEVFNELRGDTHDHIDDG